ncbi:hypothetical protein JCM1840_005631 [Sporobolomyces johnsonii]
MAGAHIVVVGAGVIGLSTAIRLQEAGYRVDIVARDVPGDEKTIQFTSPWAGAHHVSVATGDDLRLHHFDAETFRVMSEMIKSDSKVPLKFAPQIEYREQPRPDGKADELSQLSLISHYHPDFRYLTQSELPPGVSHGASFTCILIDTPHYLPYLLQRFHSLGGRLHRTSSLSSLSSALSAHPSLLSAEALVNCTGLGARDLVPDEKVFPTRGQLVIVRAPWVTEGITRLGEKGSGVYDYIIPRKSGLVVLGGCAEANNWDPLPRPALSHRIKTRCLALNRNLLPPHKRETGTIDDLDVVEEAVGLRPTREGGIRLEVERVATNDGRELPLIHNYGHGGYGYQSSWGSADAAVKLVEQALKTTSRAPVHSKL